MGMRWYLAARYSRNGEMVEFADTLRMLGQVVTCRWPFRGVDEEWRNSDQVPDDLRTQLAVEDFEDLVVSDGVISFTEIPRDTTKRPAKGGRHVEFGLGLALNKRMVVIGPKENIFHYLPSIEVYETKEEFLDVLASEQATTRGEV